MTVRGGGAFEPLIFATYSGLGRFWHPIGLGQNCRESFLV
jgi:hypothetical protein